MPPSMNGSNTTPDGEVTPQEKARVEKSIRGLEQAPSSRQQLGSFTNWRSVQNALGQPFNNERIPLSKLKLMRRDPMLAFGMHYQKMPKVKAPWYMECSDPQVAGFMDGTIRPIIASLIIAEEQKKDFGFQAIAKRFQNAAPQGTYIDPKTGEEKPAWDQTGGIQPITLKPFVALPPEGVEPMFDESTGEFTGIKYRPPQGSSPVGQKAKGSGGSSGEVEIDIYHALWVTNEIESVFGNLFGYPRLGYAYPYWWSYWMRWAIADRAFEKKGDPPIIVRHPQGEIDLGNGETMLNADYALMMAERLRAGAAISLPSEPYTNFEDRPSQIREWEIEFLKGGVDMEVFDKSFDYMDVMKIRSLFIPEQALIEGGGGTSSRNVAQEMFEGMIQGQTMDMEEIVESVNRWIIPHLMMVNFPQQFEQGITCRMKVQGFTSTDTELLSQIIQLIGQAEPDKLGIDVRAALKQLGIPLLDQRSFEKQLKEAAEKAAKEGPPLVSPTATASGVVPTKGKAPATNENTPGGTSTGFAYVAPVGLGIELSATTEAAASFMADLPSSPHYEDPTMRSFTKRLWNAMQKFYAQQYEEFQEHIKGLEGHEFMSSEEDHEEEIDFSAGDAAREFGRKIVNSWKGNLDLFDETGSVFSDILERMLKRGSDMTRRKAGLEKSLSENEIKNWVSSHIANLLPDSIRSVREELANFASKAYEESEGKITPEELSKAVEAHYSDFPKWLASRFSRAETRDAFNAATLLTGRDNGIQVAQAMDALSGNTDRHCEERDGQFFTIDQALQEGEHPGGTLAWRLVKEPVTLARVDEIPNAPTGTIGTFDPETNTIYLSTSADREDERKLCLAVGETLAA